MINNARKKPKNGEVNSEDITSVTLCQFNATPELPGKNLNARPTPKIDPISEWELEIGIPNHQLVRFHIIAVHISDIIIAIP
jgi:hypothetical protein